MLIGERIILEEIYEENIEKLRQWRNNPEMRKFFREYRDISKDQQIAWYKERGNNTNPNHIYFQIMERDITEQGPVGLDRKLIGCCGLHYIDWRLRSAEFGIFLGKSQGKGLGKEALKLMFTYGINECNLHKIWAEVFDNNKAIHLYRKLGFKDDGILRDSYFCDGKYGNSIMISLLEAEWRTFKNK